MIVSSVSLLEVSPTFPFPSGRVLFPAPCPDQESWLLYEPDRYARDDEYLMVRGLATMTLWSVIPLCSSPAALKEGPGIHKALAWCTAAFYNISNRSAKQIPNLVGWIDMKAEMTVCFEFLPYFHLFPLSSPWTWLLPVGENAPLVSCPLEARSLGSWVFCVFQACA